MCKNKTTLRSKSMLGNWGQTSFSLQMETVKLWVCCKPKECYFSQIKKKSAERTCLFGVGAPTENRASCSDSTLGGCTVHRGLHAAFHY